MIASRIVLGSALLLAGALCADVLPAASASSALPAPSAVSPSFQEGGGDEGLEMKLLARRLMTRIEEHRSRLHRLDQVTQYFRRQGSLDKIREMERLRQRETRAYQQTLSEYRRLLGNDDFDRVARAVRFFLKNDTGDDGGSNEPFRTRDMARRVENYRQQSGYYDGQPLRTRDLARRVENYRQQSGKDQPTRGPAPSVDRTLQRQLEIERARASQKMELAQRLQQARSQQLRLMAEQQRRFTPPAGAAPQGGGGGPVRPGAPSAQQGSRTRRENATRPQQRQRPR
jgi:hypothetical protein